MAESQTVDFAAKLAELRARKAAQETSRVSAEDEAFVGDLGGFLDYVTHWSTTVSPPGERLNELYESITIWEIYTRLLPHKPRNDYHPTGEISVACPHESGQTSLSMWINDAKGLYFCAHAWEGNNKMALYCEIRGLNNRADLFHHLKRLMVWEFRGEDPPYGVVETKPR